MGRNGGTSRPLSVAIVGAGFGGVGMAIRLLQSGFTDVTVFERGGTVGGVWRANTYPGAACDVPSHMYSFSFARGDRWTRRSRLRRRSSTTSSGPSTASGCARTCDSAPR